MSSLNKLMLIGNVGQDPKVKQVGENQVVSFSIATSEKWKNKSGEQQERTDWHNVEAWGKLGELVSKYVKKGSKLYAEGSLRIDTKGEGDERKTFVTMRADTVTFLDSKSKDGAATSNDGIPF